MIPQTTRPIRAIPERREPTRNDTSPAKENTGRNALQPTSAFFNCPPLVTTVALIPCIAGFPRSSIGDRGTHRHEKPQGGLTPEPALEATVAVGSTALHIIDTVARPNVTELNNRIRRERLGKSLIIAINAAPR